jgi:hypothetical protein
MAGSVVLSGNDSVTLDNSLLSDFADGAIAVLTFPNELSTTKTGKNNNTIYAENKTGENAELVLRLMKGSADDKKLNTRLAQQLNNYSQFVLVNGQLTKFLGDGRGKTLSDTYVLSGGTFTKGVEAQSNVEGNTDQSVSIYTIRFASARRAIG